MKSLIRNATVYRADIKQGEEEFRQALAETAFTDPLPSQEESYGFLAVDGEFLRTFPGGYGLTFRLDQKVIPPSALKAEIARLRRQVETNEGRTPGRLEMREIKQEARQNLSLKALARTTHVPCYYHIEKKLLIVASTSQRLCDRITSHLVHALETMKSSTIHVSVRSNLTTRLKQWVEGSGESGAFGDMEPNGRATLLSADKRTLSVKGDNLMDNFDALREVVAKGYEVKSLGLTLGGIEFVLTDTFKLCSLNHTEMPDSGDEEGHVSWAAETLIQVTSIVSAVEALCDMFGYGEEVEGGQE